MNTKAILAGITLTALFAGTSAMAQGGSGFDAFEHFNEVKTVKVKNDVVVKDVSFQEVKAETGYFFINSNR